MRPEQLAERLSRLAQDWIADEPAARADRAQRRLLSAIAAHGPATLNDVAEKLGRGAPAVSRAVDSMVRAGLVNRVQDADNRRRLSLTLTDAGRQRLAQPGHKGAISDRLARFAHSELRAIERAIEILEAKH